MKKENFDKANEIDRKIKKVNTILAGIDVAEGTLKSVHFNFHVPSAGYGVTKRNYFQLT